MTLTTNRHLVQIVWVPRHCELPRNEAVDVLEKKSLRIPVEQQLKRCVSFTQVGHRLRACLTVAEPIMKCQDRYIAICLSGEHSQLWHKCLPAMSRPCNLHIHTFTTRNVSARSTADSIQKAVFTGKDYSLVLRCHTPGCPSYTIPSRIT